MKTFLQKHSTKIKGVLSGFDRIIFRGSLRNLVYTGGMKAYLNIKKVLIKDFDKHAKQMTADLKASVLERPKVEDRPIEYLPSSNTKKEEFARKIAARDQIQNGLICTLTCVEPCMSFEIYRNPETRKLEPVYCERKCLHIYHYFNHKSFGFMHIRQQTWFPFSMQVYINGREWLSRQMAKEGLGYLMYDNSFEWLEDFDKAQKLMDSQLDLDWPEVLKDLSRLMNPCHEELLWPFQSEYYWSVRQSEWATDVMFRDRGTLKSLYPSLVQHGIMSCSSQDVLRFLGRKIPESGRIHHNFQGEVMTSYREREEGTRVRHWAVQNSIKMYDKGGNLRFETTMINPYDFKVYRRKEGDPNGQPDWRPLQY